jgi:hypothetical protein
MRRSVVIAVIWIAAVALLVLGIGRLVARTRAADPAWIVGQHLRHAPADLGAHATLLASDPPTIALRAPVAWMLAFAEGNGFVKAETPLYLPDGRVDGGRIRMLAATQRGGTAHLLVELPGERATLTLFRP